MSRYAYVNGLYRRHSDATVHIEDRGFQFADGIYEVWAVMDGGLADSDGHFARLIRSLQALEIRVPMTRQALEVILREVIRRNRVEQGLVYLQITRGAAPRDHAFPALDTPPSVIVTATRIDFVKKQKSAQNGVAVITRPDIRWGRCDIKTVGLLPNVLAKEAAKRRGATEAWFIDSSGLVTEGASTNAFIIDAQGVLRTRDLAANILHGVTRAGVLKLCQTQNIRIDERPFTLEEALGAREAFFTSASAFVMPVVSIDGHRIGDGAPGPISAALRELYIETAYLGAI